MTSASPLLPMLSEEEALEVATKLGMPTTFTFQPVWRLLLTRPKFARAFSDLLTDLRFRTVLDQRLLELVIMRLGWRTGSCLEWTQHWNIATAAGIDERDLLGTRDWQPSDRFDDRDRAILAAVDDVIEVGRITSGTWAQCVQAFSDEEMFEIVALISTYRMLSIFTTSVEMPQEEGVELWPPDGMVSPWAT